MTIILQCMSRRIEIGVLFRVLKLQNLVLISVICQLAAVLGQPYGKLVKVIGLCLVR